jgi:tetratricopeptide (TPR) repeat protein
MDREAEPLEVLCAVMEMLAQRGMREQSDAMASSLLEIHHHLFEAEEYEEAGNIVTTIQPFLDLQGRQELSKELLKKSIDSRETSNKYVAMGNLALLLNVEGKWQEALNILQECLEFFRSINAKSQMVTTISQQALIYQQRGEYEQALALEHKTLEIAEEIEYTVVAYSHIAQLLFLMEMYDKALKQGEKGLKLAHELGNQQLEAAFLHQLESLAIKEQIGDKEGQGDSLGEIGKLLLAAGGFKEALDCFQRALNIDRALGNPVKVAIALEAIGVVFGEQGHYEEALIKYQEALQLERQYSSPQDIARTERNIARVKRKM